MIKGNSVLRFAFALFIECLWLFLAHQVRPWHHVILSSDGQSLLPHPKNNCRIHGIPDHRIPAAPSAIWTETAG